MNSLFEIILSQSPERPLSEKSHTRFSIKSLMEQPAFRSLVLRDLKAKPRKAIRQFYRSDSQTEATRQLETIEIARSKILLGELGGALEQLNNLQEKASPELLPQIHLELGRIYLSMERWQEAEEVLSIILPDLLPGPSALMFAQLWGQLCIQNGKFSEAISVLEDAICHHNLDGTLPIHFQIHGFLVQSYLENQQLDFAQFQLGILCQKFRNLTHAFRKGTELELFVVDRLYTVLRTELLIERHLQTAKVVPILLECEVISMVLGHKFEFERCERERKQRGVAHSNLRRVARGQSWAYFFDERIILNYSDETRAFILTDKPQLSAFLESLLFSQKPGIGVPASTLFETITGREYHKDRDDGYVRTTLNLLRNFLPPTAVLYENSNVFIL